MARTKDPIFLGVTKAPSRKFVTAALAHTLESHPLLILPAAGQFNLARAAIAAGYEKENIATSDVSLFSALVGGLFDPEPEPVAYSIADEFEGVYGALSLDQADPAVRAAFMLWLMKRCQLAKLHYRAASVDDMDENVERHVSRLLSQLRLMMEFYQGIGYRHRDLRDIISEEHPADSIVVVNPPLYGSDPQFDFGDAITFDPGVPQLKMNKEYGNLYDLSKLSEAPYLWYRVKESRGYPVDEIVYSIEEKPRVVNSWLCTKPEVFDGFAHKYGIATFSRHHVAPIDAPIWGADDTLTDDTEVRVVTCLPATAYYYRDLFAHRLGVPSGNEWYGLILLDGKVFGMLMFMMGNVRTLEDDYAFLNSGFAVPSNVYPRTSRLLNLIITSRQFEPYMRASSFHNRYWSITGIKTVAFSKYRKSKAANGIYVADKHEAQPDRNYKIWYHADFRDDTWQDCVARFIREEAEFVEQERQRREARDGAQ
jgi:hypothetical protein